MWDRRKDGEGGAFNVFRISSVSTRATPGKQLVMYVQSGQLGGRYNVTFQTKQIGLMIKTRKKIFLERLLTGPCLLKLRITLNVCICQTYVARHTYSHTTGNWGGW